jgi:hypothetical protein
MGTVRRTVREPSLTKGDSLFHLAARSRGVDPKQSYSKMQSSRNRVFNNNPQSAKAPELPGCAILMSINRLSLPLESN